MYKLKLIIVIISLSNYSHMHCAERTLDIYQSDCLQILEKHKTKLVHYKTDTLGKDLLKEGSLILQKLTKCKNNLIQQKQDALNNIKTSPITNDIAWNTCLQLVSDIEEFNKNNRHLPLPDVQHDTNIPEHLRALIIKQLEAHQINPKRINILGRLQGNFLYVTTSPGPNIPLPIYAKSYDAKSLFQAKNIVPGMIDINIDRISQLHTYCQMALCFRIVEDIAQHIHITPMAIKIFEPLLTDKPDIIMQSPQLKAYKNLCQHKLTVFLPSITNPVISGYMLNLAINCNDHVFSQYDFNLLAKIDRYNKILLWISEQIKS